MVRGARCRDELSHQACEHIASGDNPQPGPRHCITQLAQREPLNGQKAAQHIDLPATHKRQLFF